MGKTFFISTPCSSRGMTPHMSYRKRGKGGEEREMGESTATEIAFSVSPLSTHYPFFSWWGIAEKKFSSLLWVFLVRGLPTPSSIFDVYARSLPVPSLRGAKGSVHEKDSGFFPLFSHNVCVSMSTRKEIGGNHIISFFPIPSLYDLLSA